MKLSDVIESVRKLDPEDRRMVLRAIVDDEIAAARGIAGALRGVAPARFERMVSIGKRTRGHADGLLSGLQELRRGGR